MEVIYENLRTMDSDDSILTKTGDIVNDLIHKEIEWYSQSDAESLNSIIKHLDINEQIQNKLQRFNIFCGILFCTNMRVPTPLHMLLSDTVEGSQNPTTHDGFVARFQRQRRVWDDLEPDVNNFDIHIFKPYFLVYLYAVMIEREVYWHFVLKTNTKLCIVLV